MKGTFFCAAVFLLVGTMQVLPSDVTAAPSESRKAWVPKSKHGDARTLVDPGPAGLLGQYKLLTLKLPEFIATYQGPAGKLSVRVHPPNPASGVKASWTGERVALTMLATNLDREELSRAMAAIITIVKRREERWGWLWRPAAGRPVAQDPFAGVYRNLAYAQAEGIEEALRGLNQNDPIEFVALLDGLELAYRAGKKSFALVLAGKLARVSEERLARGDRTPIVLQSNRLLLARTFALAGRTDQLKRIQGGILGSSSVCKATTVARALDASGRKKDALEFVEEEILSRTKDCARALDLAVALRLRNDDLEGAKSILKAHSGSLTNRPATYLARARVELAAGNLDQGVDLLRTALRFNPKQPEIFDLLAIGLLLNRKPVAALTEAKKRREEKLRLLADQVYAGILCAAYQDSFCVGAAHQSAKALVRDAQSLPIRILETLDAMVAGKRDSLETRLRGLWQSEPHLVIPLLIEKLDNTLPEKPSVKVLSSHVDRVYGPGLGRHIHRLASVSTTAPESTQLQPTLETPQQKDAPQPAENGNEEAEFPFPLWLLLTLGGILAFFGLVAAIKQRQERTTSKPRE